MRPSTASLGSMWDLLNTNERIAVSSSAVFISRVNAARAAVVKTKFSEKSLCFHNNRSTSQPLSVMQARPTAILVRASAE